VDVISIELLGGFLVRVAFADGFVRDLDLEPFLHGPIFEPVRDPAFFARVRVDSESGTITWPNGADIAPEALRAGHPLDGLTPSGERPT
jgi:hypothetical protein